jgi:predicted ATPase/class 3 adenylate cyclase
LIGEANHAADEPNGMASVPESSRVGPPIPTGTVTFVFTDIEGSTVRWDRDRAAMQDAVRQHDAIVRAAIAAHQGYVFKTIGDAFCAAFSRPEDAVAAMLDAQRALKARDFTAVDGIRVRMAGHTGTADERAGDYFGAAVDRVARLLSIAHGGQMLLSGATSALVVGSLPTAAELRDLGQHRLKDLAQPEHVRQLVAPELRADFPPLRSLDILANNLPWQTTSFIGRETEVAEITALLAKHHLVTLVGSGGVGKTRTSLHVAANAVDGNGDGVWFVELAPLLNGDSIPTAIAQATGITLGDGDPVEQLVAALAPKTLLLILDNCEHVVDAAARVVSAVFNACPRVAILASSRQALKIRGEVTYRMPSLAVPAAGAALDELNAEHALEYAAIALFVERAQAVNYRFAFSDANAPIVAEICQRLDGVALAIELAAARVNVLSLTQIRDRLDERFRVLTGGNRDRVPRQQTLRALIDWSYDLLDEREQLVFRRLGTFANAFTLEFATAVAGGGELDEFEVFDLVASLVEKSLLITQAQEESVRYRLLESTRAYAREKLDIAERTGSAERHLRFLLDRNVVLDERWETTGRRSELEAAVATEIDEIRAALAFALHGDNVSMGAALLAATRLSSWRALGLEHEGVAGARAFLTALPHAEPLLRARLWTGIAFVAQCAAQKTRALEAATHALRCARVAGDTRVLIEALCRYAHGAMFLGHFADAEANLAEAESLPSPSVAQRLLLLEARGMLSGQRGDAAAAVRATEGLLREYRALGNATAVRSTTLNLAEMLHIIGDTQRAVDLIRDALPDFRASGNRNTLVNGMANFAGYLAATDRFSEASSIARELIGELASREPTHTHIAVAIEPLALVVAFTTDPARAATLEGYADTALRNQGFTREFTETTTHDRLMTLLTQRLAPADLAHRLAEGAALTPEAAVELALLS